MVTRRPLELRLVRITKERSVIPFAVFEEDKKNEISNFDMVRNKIVEYTDAVAGKRQGIKDDPIILTIYTHTCPDLTIIDLPGITKIPLRDSDQNDEIEKVTKGMAIRFKINKK